LIKVQLFQTMICALITGMVYFQTAISADTIISINGILFNLVRNLNFMFQFQAVPVLTMELTIMLRENANGIYTSTAYFIGKNLAELPQYIILPTIYNIIVYWMSGLYPDILMFLFATLTCVLLTNVAISISYAVATLFGRTDVAMTFLPIFVIPMLAFGGFFITFEAIPSYFTWLSALSYFKLPKSYSYIFILPKVWLGSIKTAIMIPPFQIDFDGISKWTDVAILSGMIAIIRLVAYLALLVRTYRNR
uniref:ABC2_membrane domain-containing protein n=1 Tax=Heligmosomoides polygyrus TaxID=6339 RepID=A0A183F553_HELPZ